MTTLKVMSIIGIIITAIAFLIMAVNNNAYDYEGAIGWGIILSVWSLAYSIVGLVQSKRHAIK